MRKSQNSVFSTTLITLLIVLTIWTFSRLGLSLWLHGRIEQSDWGSILVGGLRVDLSTAAFMLIPAILLLLATAFAPKLPLVQGLRTTLLPFYLATMIALTAMMELATPAFILQYDIRPNRLFIEYLVYPKEVMSMLLTGHFSMLVNVFALTVLTWFVSWRTLKKQQATKTERRLATVSKALVWLLLALLAARGSVSHRPLNPSLVYFSTDSLLNSLSLNSTYSVFFAFKNLINEKSSAQLYGALNEKTIISLVNAAAHKKNLANEAIPTLAYNPPYQTQQRKNLVIVLEESLGAQFVSELGGKALTPELDKLYQQGWGFNHMFATGTRSVRGIEAVITGFPPSPSRAVVKLSKSQEHFFTIASLLAQQGYQTQFIYGGESHFDNMKSFFLGNGFQQIIDLPKFEHPKFVSSWGASDEDLFSQADKELTKLAATKQPFFSLIFTSSNHDPFALPPTFSLPELDSQSDNLARDRAINYADHALGQFFAHAETQPYWQDTVFLVVADHDIRAYGSEAVPVKSFHIPAVFINSGINKRDTRLTSQLDLPVTALSLIGVDQPTPMLGLDLTKSHAEERAIMQYYDNFAYIENEFMAVLAPNRQVSYWSFDKTTNNLVNLPAQTPLPALHEKALAHVLFSQLAYEKQLYQLP